MIGFNFQAICPLTQLKVLCLHSPGSHIQFHKDYSVPQLCETWWHCCCRRSTRLHTECRARSRCPQSWRPALQPPRRSSRRSPQPIIVMSWSPCLIDEQCGENMYQWAVNVKPPVAYEVLLLKKSAVGAEEAVPKRGKGFRSFSPNNCLGAS